jgi:hypothetical protein
MKQLVFGLAVAAWVSVAAAADGTGPAAATAAGQAATPGAAGPPGAPTAVATGSKEIDPVKAAMGDGACCTDGTCDEAAVRKPFLSPRAAQMRIRK